MNQRGRALSNRGTAGAARDMVGEIIGQLLLDASELKNVNRNRETLRQRELL